MTIIELEKKNHPWKGYKTFFYNSSIIEKAFTKSQNQLLHPNHREKSLQIWGRFDQGTHQYARNMILRANLSLEKIEMVAITNQIGWMDNQSGRGKKLH